MHHPAVARHLARRPAVDPGDDPAQHRRRLDLRDLGVRAAASTGTAPSRHPGCRGRRTRARAAGRSRVIAARRLVSICPIVASTDSPSPSASTAGSVSPRGAPSAATAARNARRPRNTRARAIRRASQRSPSPTSPSTASAPATPPSVPSASAHVPDSQTATPASTAATAGDLDQPPRPRPAADPAAVQRRRPQPLGPRQRPQRKQQRRQRPVKRCLGQRRQAQPEGAGNGSAAAISGPASQIATQASTSPPRMPSPASTPIWIR